MPKEIRTKVEVPEKISISISTSLLQKLSLIGLGKNFKLLKNELKAEANNQDSSKNELNLDMTTGFNRSETISDILEEAIESNLVLYLIDGESFKIEDLEEEALSTLAKLVVQNLNIYAPISFSSSKKKEIEDFINDQEEIEDFSEFLVEYIKTRNSRDIMPYDLDDFLTSDNGTNKIELLISNLKNKIKIDMDAAKANGLYDRILYEVEILAKKAYEDFINSPEDVAHHLESLLS